MIFDPDLIDELARVFARAAVDRLMAELEGRNDAARDVDSRPTASKPVSTPTPEKPVT